MIRDTLTHLDLSIYPEIALILFVGVFVAISIRVMRRGGACEARQASRLPLEDGPDMSSNPTLQGRARRGGE